MDEVTQRLIADFGGLEPVYVDGVAGTFNLGANFAMLFFRYRPVFRDGHMVYDRVPALHLVRPMTSLMGCKDCIQRKMLELGPAADLPNLIISNEVH